MRKSKEVRNREQEILDATKNLLEQGYYYKDVNIKEISQVTSFSRPSIYNYFQTKEEIFLTLLTREYESWTKELERFNSDNIRISRLEFAKKLARSLDDRPLMLKLIANNLTDFEENSRIEYIVSFKSAYGSTLRAVEEGLVIFIPEFTEEQRTEFIYAFFPFLYGLNSYAVGTEKQRIGLKEAGVEYTYHSVYNLVLNLLKKLLEIKGEYIMSNKAKIALGTWSWGVGGFAGGNVVFGNQLDTKDLEEVFSKAIDNGLNLFDTAFVYANGESERILGELVAKYDRKDVIISDKFSPGAQNNEAENPVMDMLEGSLKRLGTDFIDIYWIHNSADVEKWTPYLVDVVKSGKVGRIGVSNHNLEEVKRVQEILAPSGLKITAVQNHFSLLYRESIDSGLLDYCKENGIEFFSYMVLEQGALSGKYDENNLLPEDSNRGKTYNPLFPKIKELLDGLRVIADKYKVSVAQVATAWAIGRGTTPILGVTKVEQIEDAAKSVNLDLDEKEIKYLEELAIASEVDTRGGWEGQA